MNKKVRYLPHVQEHLQEKFTQMNQLINEDKFRLALPIIENLLKHEYKTEQLYIKKLYCLSELKRWREVEQFAELLRSEKPEPQYDLYYMVSLFKQEQYKFVIDFVYESIDLEQVPKNIYKEMKYLYDESKRMIKNKAAIIDDELQLAIVTKNDRDQWLLFHQWDKLNIEPPDLFLFMLQEDCVNPFVKTYILQTLSDWQAADVVIVQKFGKCKRFKLNEISNIMNHPIYHRTIEEMQSLEQSNPTLHDLVIELFERYIQYIYPFMYEGEDARFVGEAVIALARHYLEGIDVDEKELTHKTVEYIKRIQKSNENYFELIMS